MPARDVTITVIYTAIPAPQPEDTTTIIDYIPYTILEDYDTPLGIGNLSVCVGDRFE